MPIIKAAKKSLRQDAKRKAENLAKKKKFKGLVKKIKALEIDEAKKLVPEATKAIDKAAKAGIIKKNTASRKKAGLHRVISQKSKD